MVSSVHVEQRRLLKWLPVTKRNYKEVMNPLGAERKQPSPLPLNISLAFLFHLQNALLSNLSRQKSNYWGLWSFSNGPVVSIRVSDAACNGVESVLYLKYIKVKSLKKQAVWESLCFNWMSFTSGSRRCCFELQPELQDMSVKGSVTQCERCSLKRVLIYNPPSPRPFWHLQAPSTSPALSLSTHHYTHPSLWTSLSQTSSLQPQTQGFYHKATESPPHVQKIKVCFENSNAH